jgi:hypothetical protein
MSNCYDMKTQRFVDCVAANLAHMTLDEAIDLARELAAGMMDSAHMRLAEEQARAALRSYERS